MPFQLLENVSLAVSGLRANKLRALLTMLGIIIGIGSVITIVTVGDAMTSSVTSVFNDMGANSIQLMMMDKPDENGNTNWNRSYEPEDYISDEMLELYEERFGEEIDCWAVTVNAGTGQMQVGRNQANGYVYGTNAGALRIQNITPIAGHDLNDREVDGDKNVAVVAKGMLEKLMPGVTPQEALGREFRVQMAQGLYTFSIVGVYDYQVGGMMAAMGGDTSSQIFIPLGVAKQIARDGASDPNELADGYYVVQVKAKAGVDVEDFARRSETFFNNAFYRSNPYVEVEATNMDSIIGQMSSIMDTIKAAVSVIAAISLLVGGIGVMNIMLVSVTERTREIGTRKALGARNSAIRIQFIVESMIICLIGGTLGVLLGAGLGMAGSAALGAPSLPSVPAVVVAVGFSMGIGIFFGYYPANKAAKLDPIEALRYE